MNKSCMKVGLHCSFEGGAGTITEVDNAQGIALLSEDETGVMQSRSHHDLNVDDAQFHNEEDRYY